MSKYKMSIDPTKTSASFLNIRSTPSVLGKDLGNFLPGSVAEGDIIVESNVNQPWLKVTKIDNLDVTQESYISAWNCKIYVNNVVEEPVPTYGKVRLDSSYSSDGPFQIEDEAGKVLYTSGPNGGTIKISSIEKIVIRTP